MTAHRPLDEADIMLIQHVKATPSLYDPNNEDFRQQQRKEEDWEKVANSLNIKVPDAKRRWTCLRDRYSRELKQLRMHPIGGEYGRNDFFRRMDFLRDFVRKRRERGRRDTNTSSNTWCKAARIHKTELSEVDSLVADEGDDTQIYDSSEHNYDTKLEVHTTHPEAYAMLVEEEGPGSYAEYTVQHSGATNNDTKHINMLLPHATASSSSSTCSTGPTTHLAGAPHSYTICKGAETLTGQVHHLPMPPELQLKTNLGLCQTTLDTSAAMEQCENEDLYFCKAIAAYLHKMTRIHKIQAKVEMFQILAKYIEIEEAAAAAAAGSGSVGGGNSS